MYQCSPHNNERPLKIFLSVALAGEYFLTSPERGVYCPYTQNFKLPCYCTQTSNASQYFQ